jgi:hypothetical protein
MELCNICPSPIHVQPLFAYSLAVGVVLLLVIFL